MTTESNNDVYIVAAKRTPIGSFQGQFANTPATDLGAAAVKAVIDEVSINQNDIDEALIGCVLPAGLGQAPARQAVLHAGLPLSVRCTTINKVCGSGMKTVMMAHDTIKAGSADLVIAGGLESMTMAPYLLPKARGGYRMGHAQMLDHMFFDGLQNPYDGNMMGNFAESCADKYNYSREAQDEFSAESVRRAMTAIETGAFENEITAVEVKSRKATVVASEDEEPAKCDISKIPHLRPAFRRENGTVTAANASKISDGASMTLLASAQYVNEHNLTPLAKIVGHHQFAHEPEWFTTAPVTAIEKLMKKINWSVQDVDLFEINEAFAVVTMAAMDELNLPHDKVNVNGGATALGHPIGASGNRILVTLIHALKNRGLKKGVASLCIGGGEATAIAVELV
ncbi:acetyl-CoA C-acyltransferase [Marinicella sp. S1101]|uniref:thiolase family protein n=1 Tax=Marinicella marina TaxID=2996016 RepID=UPI00226081AF|nr:acetyl-CoA C-acyltransferase [Marinicella marina]MCX7554071.1 acetyl-CoA C-acyltransferase [Marinicella marina]MDJ1141236.1 acetyl-CoA C-acyltransferase [Marinicella marina]